MPDVTPPPAPKVAPRDTAKRETKIAESPDINAGKEALTSSIASDLEAAGNKVNAGPREAAGQPTKPVRSEEPAANGMGGGAQLLDTALDLTSRNIETVVQSTSATLRAAETVTQTAVEYGQRNFRQLSTMMRDLWEVRTFADFVSLQREHTRAVVDTLLEETTQLSDQLNRTFGDIVDCVVKQQSGKADMPQRKAA